MWLVITLLFMLVSCYELCFNKFEKKAIPRKVRPLDSANLDNANYSSLVLAVRISIPTEKYFGTNYSHYPRDYCNRFSATRLSDFQSPLVASDKWTCGLCWKNMAVTLPNNKWQLNKKVLKRERCRYCMECEIYRCIFYLTQYY